MLADVLWVYITAVLTQGTQGRVLITFFSCPDPQQMTEDCWVWVNVWVFKKKINKLYPDHPSPPPTGPQPGEK